MKSWVSVKHFFSIVFYRTQVWSYSLLFTRLNWYDSGLWRCQLKTSWRASVADVDAEDRVDSLVEVLNLKFGRDFEPWFWSWKLVKILRYMFGQDFDANVWLSFKVVTLLIALNPSAFGNVSLFAVKMLNRIVKIF